MHLLVGLGNPGPNYARNRHNIGFLAIDEIIGRYRLGPTRQRFHGAAASGTVDGETVLALKPATYVNESGRAVGAAMRYHKLTPADVTVIYDELDLPPGKLRVKRGGGNAGHNGLKSIDAHIGRDYRRVRLGIGHPGDSDQVTGYVLHDFSRSDETWLGPLLAAVGEALPLLLQGDDAGFMSKVALILAPPSPRPRPAS